MRFRSPWQTASWLLFSWLYDYFYHYYCRRHCGFTATDTAPGQTLIMYNNITTTRRWKIGRELFISVSQTWRRKAPDINVGLSPMTVSRDPCVRNSHRRRQITWIYSSALRTFHQRIVVYFFFRKRYSHKISYDIIWTYYTRRSSINRASLQVRDFRCHEPGFLLFYDSFETLWKL